MATYDSIRRQLRTLESTLDGKLTTYSKLASSIPRASSSASSSSTSYDHIGVSSRELAVEVEGMLEKLREANEQLARVLERPDAPAGAAVSHAVQRHREVMQDYVRDFRRTKANVQTALDQANLLSNVQGDIEAYKTSRSSTTDALLTERGHIDSSHRMADDLLAHAHDTRSEFARQRTNITGINARMGGVLNSFPSINNVISLVNTRRRRDAVIMGCVIGLCLVLLWGYMGR